MGSTHDVLSKALDSVLEVKEFELHSSCNDYFLTNSLGKGMNCLFLELTTLFFSIK